MIQRTALCSKVLKAQKMTLMVPKSSQVQKVHIQYVILFHFAAYYCI